jgi:hypothetical protein
VYELFNKEVFKDKRIDGSYSISASTQVHEFNERLRKLAKDNIKAETKVFSEEDLRKAIDIARKDTYKRESVDEIIQSLKQPKTPKWFVAEIEYQNLEGKWSSYYPFASSAKDSRLKITIKNEEIYLAGRYENN